MNRPDRPLAEAWTARVVIAILLVAAGCGGGGTEPVASGQEGGMEDISAEGQVGNDGGIIAGEGIEITVPAGAVSEGAIAAIKAAVASLPTTGRGAAFGPAAMGAIQITTSTALNQDVTVRVVLFDDVTDAAGKIEVPLMFAVHAQADGGISAPGGQLMTVNGNSGDAALQFDSRPTPPGTTSGTILFVESAVHATATAAGPGAGPGIVTDVGSIEMLGLGDDVNVHLELSQDPAMAADGSLATVWANGGATFTGGSGFAPETTTRYDFGLDGVDAVDAVPFDGVLSCVGGAEDGGGAGGDFSFDEDPGVEVTLHADTVLMVRGGDGGGGEGGAVQLGDEYRLESAPMVLCTTHPTGGGPGLPPPPGDATLSSLDEADGVVVVDPVLGFPDGTQGQGNGPAPLLCTVAYKDGVVIADLTSGTVLNTLDYLQDSPLGSVPLSFVPPSPGTRGDALLSFYNDGYGITHYDPVAGIFGATQIDPQSGSVSDVNRYEEDAGYAVLVQSGGNRVRFVEPNTDAVPGQTFFQVVGGKQIGSSLFAAATGFVITAARRNATSPVYFVTVGANPAAAGSLWRKNDPADFSTPATLVGGVGAFPRRLRFAGPVGAVSNSQSDTLTILARDASDNVTIKGTVDVGDQPIGIDLLVLPNGNIGALSTGFSDHTYTVTILEPDGDVVSSDTSPVPGGGLNPAHAVWANAEGTRIAVSCYGSDEVRIFSID